MGGGTEGLLLKPFFDVLFQLGVGREADHGVLTVEKFCGPSLELKITSSDHHLLRKLTVNPSSHGPYT